ncbi:MAG: formate dehydrogenase accessory sulfurtransferase FdhD [Lachnospiraceae bacterium]|nr:formate dehydrogenase accessory sulfurtransferase FdhD [Lachnospiraceae bacterium]
MFLKNDYQPIPLTGKTSMQHITLKDPSSICERTDLIAHEHNMEVWINGSLFIRFNCSGKHLEQLIIGYLKTEGFLRSLNEINSLSIRKDGTRADLEMPVYPNYKNTPGKLTPISWNPTQILSYSDEFLHASKEFALTGCFHSAALLFPGQTDSKEAVIQTDSKETVISADSKETVILMNDIKRHNAIDKAVGEALLRGLAPDQAILFTSGRVPSDMASKAIHAGIPMLVSRAAVTLPAIELAKKYGLTLCGFVRSDRMNIYHREA